MSLWCWLHINFTPCSLECPMCSSSLLITKTSGLCLCPGCPQLRVTVQKGQCITSCRGIDDSLPPQPYRWFFASSTLQLFALQICVCHCILRNDLILGEFAHWQTCDLFSSWHTFFCWLLLLSPKWIPGHTKKHCHVCSTSYYTLPYRSSNHQRILCDHKLHSWASHLWVDDRGQHTSV